MSKGFFALPLVLIAFSLRCANDDGSGASTTAGGSTNGGSSTGGSSGTDTGGSGGDSGSTTGGSAGQGGSSGSAGSGGTSAEGGAGDSGGPGEGGAGTGGTGTGGGGQCSPSADDGECVRCLQETCCETWQACAADTNCNACAQCLDDGSNLAECVSMTPMVCDLTSESEIALVACVCNDVGGICTSPCATPCGYN
jgi:hypothetical protein